MSDPNIYTVGWICAISTEYVAAQAFLDETHDSPEEVTRHDNNDYSLGRIGKHNVVIAVLPAGEYGTDSAAGVARDMLHSFPNIRIGLMVGIGGGAPTAKHDIRLGDIVVSTPQLGRGGVFQYDFGKEIQCQEFEAIRFLNQPPNVLRTAVNGLMAHYELEGHTIQASIENAFQRRPRLRQKYGQPDPITDRLYRADVIHSPEVEGACSTSCGSDAPLLLPRHEREDNPMIHYGLIASANKLMKNAVLRDKLALEKEVLCFEMEAAGLMNHFPCLVIRGICDYSDTHKNKQWQGYAAMAAAAYAKDLLNSIPPNRLEAEKKLSESLKDMHMDISDIRVQTRMTKTRVEELRADDHHYKIRNWLRAPDPSTNFNKARAQHHEGTGQWLLNSEVYTKWKTEQNSFLWLHGIPGCGKTILSSSVIMDLKQSTGSAQTLLYFYFDFNNVDKQSVDKAVRSLIDQLYSQQNGPRKEIDDLYSLCDNGRRQPDSTSLLALLRNLLQHQHDGATWIVMDALNECYVRDEGRASDLMSLVKDLRECTANVHLLVTSRPEHDIRSAIESWAHSSEIIHLQSTLVEDDINLYIKDKTSQLSRWQRRPGIQEMIETDLSRKANGMFSWVSCQFDILSKCLDPESIQSELASLPRTLDETYDRILRTVEPSLWNSAMRLLQFLTYSERPLTLAEAVDAIAVNTSREPSFDPESRMPCPEEIIQYCSSLAVLVKRKDKKDETVIVEIHLAHFSVQEYLMSERLDGGIARELSRSIASTALTTVCLSYLLDLDHSGQPKEARKDYPLAQYSAQYWPKYAAVAEQEARSMLPLVQKYLSSIPAINFCCQIHDPDEPWRDNPEANSKASALYYASLLGLPYHVQMLLDDGANVNARGGRFGNALQAALSRGHEEIARMLIVHGAEVNDEGGYYNTALCAASAHGEINIVDLLLRTGANAAADGAWHGNALQAACARGYDEIANILLRQNHGPHVNAVTGGIYGTALQAAAQAGQISTVQLLLENDANVNTLGGKYGFALQGAAINGFADIVKLLINHNASVHIQSGIYGTALQAAARGGHYSILQLLLDNNADIYAHAGLHGTALQAAAHGGHSRSVQLLLDEKADIYAQGGMYRDALQAAKSQHHDKIICLLEDWQETKDSVDSDTASNLALLENDHTFCKQCHVLGRLLVERPKRFFVRLGRVQEMNQRRNCCVCSLVSHILDTYGPHQSITGAMCTLYPKPDRLLFSVYCDHKLRGHIQITPQTGSASRKRLKAPNGKHVQGNMTVNEVDHVASNLDLKRVQHLLSQCDKDHPLCARLTQTPSRVTRLPSMLIDVREDCLVDADSSFVYIALSYVRGTSDMLETTAGNVSGRKEKHALSKLYSAFPRIIRDAVITVRQLGYQYLWVDALCILQDEGDRKFHEIMRMDRIYGQADLTLAALSGENADKALPGVDEGSRPSRRAIRVIPTTQCDQRGTKSGDKRSYETEQHSTEMRIEALIPGIDLQSDLLPYEKRAWTFQERLLSRRCLYFTQHQAYLHCESSFLLEDQESENQESENVPENSSLSFRRLQKTHDAIANANLRELRGFSFNLARFQEYSMLVEQYSQRSMSKDDDILNAFLGVISVLRHNWVSKFTFGIPSSLFHDALLWLPTSDLLDRRQSVGGQFPSWSWIGWKGGVQYVTHDARYQAGVQSSIAFSINGMGVGPEDYQLGDFKDPENSNLDPKFLEDISPDQSASFWNSSASPRPIFLQFETDTVEFGDFVFSYSTRSTNGTDIHDKNSDRCGFLPFFKIQSDPPSSDKCKLLKLSRLAPHLDDSTTQIKSDIGFDIFDLESFGSSTDSWSILNIMLVKLDSSEEFAERVAVGQIHESAWENASPRSEKINLQ